MKQQITQGHLQKGTKLIQNPALDADLKYASENCGVFVLWAPHNSGKSTYLRAFAAQLQAEGKDVIFISLDVSRAMGPKWFREELDIDDCDENLEKLFPEPVDGKPVVIIIDQFDDILVTEQKKLIVFLAQQSFLTGGFMVILAVSNSSKAAEILQWNHGRKIKLLGEPGRHKWTETMVAELFSTAAVKNDSRRDQFIKLGTTGGIIGDLLPIIANPGLLVSSTLLSAYQTTQEAHLLEWQSGATLVAQASQEAQEGK